MGTPEIPTISKSKKLSSYEAALEKGEKNEARAGELTDALIQKLKEKNPDTILVARCMRSPKHHSEDRRDERGEDLRIRLEVLFSDGHRENNYGIYDVKSSEYWANEKERKSKEYKSFMNTRIRAQERNAKFYKTLVVNDDKTDLEIQEEILKDLIEAKLLPESINF